MALLEQYSHQKEGFVPLLLTEKWQVAQINYAKDQDISNITSIDIHFETDEIFVLLKGNAVIITARKKGDDFCFETHVLQPNVVYNVPKMVWHNIALDKDAQVLIVEDAGSHLRKYEIIELSEDQKNLLKRLLVEAIASKSWNN